MPGQWDGDLLFGDAYSQIATLVERHTRYVMWSNRWTKTPIPSLQRWLGSSIAP